MDGKRRVLGFVLLLDDHEPRHLRAIVCVHSEPAQCFSQSLSDLKDASYLLVGKTDSIESLKRFVQSIAEEIGRRIGEQFESFEE